MRKLFGSKRKKKRPLNKTQADDNGKSQPLDEQQPDDGKKTRKRSKSNLFQKPLTRKHIIYGSLIIVGTFFIAAALRVLIGGLLEDSAARSEYELLRTHSPAVSSPAPTPDDLVTEESDEEEAEEEDEDYEDEEEVVPPLSFDELAAINRDFIGWISDGGRIDYPIVRGSDNVKYINTTFFGNRNTAGTIFMDYRNTGGFDEHVSILYGHNTRDGSMFTSLVNLLDPDYRSRNPNITITTLGGTTLTYKVFAAIITDAWDISYTIGISDSERAVEVFPDAPSDASRFLLLSTCTRSSETDERILVFAAIT